MREPSTRRAPRWIERVGHVLSPLDRVCNRIYGSRYNPLYQSGTLAVGMLLVLTVTGIYQLIFYRVGAPYESIAAMHDDVWNSWIRSLHRYAADLAIAAAVVHALRMFLQGRTWGPRALAWLTGLLLLGLMLFIGWTGYVLVWDRQGQLIAMQGARLLDVLPLFSEPLQRAFISNELITSTFFFMNLFLHIALPLVLLLFLWVHTVRVARPALFPPRRLLWGSIAALVVLSVVWPAALPPQGDALDLLGRVRIDWFFGFWLPAARALSPPVHLALWVGGFLLLASVPLWWRPRQEIKEEPSFVNEPFCTGCTQCYLDCPYEAISMVPRTVGHGSEQVAHVNPSLCVSCGICAGSCAPMQVGPPGRQGRDQLEQAAAFVQQYRPRADTVVFIACRNGVGDHPTVEALEGVQVYEPASCAGSVHTSVIEYLLRRGAGGVYIAGCPPRDCVFREGPKWLEQRVYHDREAELHERVERARVRLGFFGHAGLGALLADVQDFRAVVRGEVTVPPAEDEVELEEECDVPEVSHG